MKSTLQKQLNKAKKTVLSAIFAALITTSVQPQIAHAEAISTNSFESSVPEVVAIPVIIKQTLRITATAYSSTPDQTDATPFTTSNGTEVYDGLIAANWLKYGTKIRIPDMFGDKVFTVNDRMNARYDTGRLDVWMKTRDAAKQFGIRHIRIQVIE